MRNGLLIVGSANHPLHADRSAVAVFDRWGRCDWIEWQELVEAHLNTSTHTLLLLDATHAVEPARRLLLRLRDNPLRLPVCVLVPATDLSLVQLASEVADDFLLAPAHPEELHRRICRILGPDANEPTSADIAATLATEIGLNQLIGRDPAFVKVLSQLALFAANEAPVLVTGETGTGKELCARVLHLLSRRHLGPFIPVDCGALPDHLFENELFGHARGAFTDARTDQKGLVALAQHGTLFLDEIDSLSLSAQSKLLRLIQEHTYRPLGSEVFKQADVRILAATNRNLEQLVEQKVFRSDLFFRINVLRLRLPALSERASDIPLLSRHFVAEIARNSGMPRKLLTHAAENRLLQHNWPGNVRELYNILQRAVICSTSMHIPASAIELPTSAKAHDFDSRLVKEPAKLLDTLQDFRRAKFAAVESFERGYIQSMMSKHQGNVTQAAREAGKERRAFGRLAKKYISPE